MSSWGGIELDDVGGDRVGRIQGGYVDAESGEPVWLVVALGRRRKVKKVAVPIRECAVAAGRAWTAQGRDAIRTAQAIDPSRPLLREHEAAICAHYGMGEGSGRKAEISGRAAGTITAQPA